MSGYIVIAVDGPAAAGKGTLARKLAERTGLPYLDTGLLYRAVARKMLSQGIDPASSSGEQQARMLCSADMERDDLRTADVDRTASLVAGQPEVRAALVDTQRRFASERGAVLDGRDIGTVIFPDATLKLYITASPETRAYRRFLQRGGNPDAPEAEKELATIAAGLRERDEADSSRASAPLRMAEDAVRLDTDNLDATEALDRVLAIVQARIPALIPV
ncbi:(d)CMP kinase [Acetobacter sp. AN02]|uniref:(d)CMP kinase n=1 Tax=Acetobacter sp. AN02 TaxID=2894186 RepID=UPI002434350C|nr:(d)CMP kinase [Acetobacter sp. AN02]MDG6094874.1 (d)CMP kinase [Acetobacter sp. AN02]